MIREGFFSPDLSADRAFFLAGFPLISLSKRPRRPWALSHTGYLSATRSCLPPDSRQQAGRRAFETLGQRGPWAHRKEALSFTPANSNIRWAREHGGEGTLPHWQDGGGRQGEGGRGRHPGEAAELQIFSLKANQNTGRIFLLLCSLSFQPSPRSEPGLRIDLQLGDGRCVGSFHPSSVSGLVRGVMRSVLRLYL